LLWSQKQDIAIFDSSLAVLNDLFNQLGTFSSVPDLNTRVQSEMSNVRHSLENPGPLTALTHGDVCVDNILVLPAHQQSIKPDIVLIDWTSAGIRHAFMDIAAIRMLFPTCWYFN
jgi:thiamine kinase-like enzyme